MELTRESILKLESGDLLDGLVKEFVLKDEPSREYSTNMNHCLYIIGKYHKNFCLNYQTPYNSFALGWHCNIRGIHIRGCKNPMEAICKAVILLELGLYEDSEIYQKEKYDILDNEHEDYHTERFDELSEIINNLEADKLYTKAEIKQRFGMR